MITREEYANKFFFSSLQVQDTEWFHKLKCEKIDQGIYIPPNTLFYILLTSCFITYIGDCHDIF